MSVGDGQQMGDGVNGRSITRAISAACTAIAIGIGGPFFSTAEAASGGANGSGSCPIAGADSGAQRIVMGASPDAGGAAAAGAEAGPAPAAAMTVVAASTAGDAGSTEPVEPAQAETAPLPGSSDVEPEPEVMAAAPKAMVSKAPPRRTRPKPVPDGAKKVWWPAKASGRLNLTYAGQASFTGAIALLFDANFENPESANQNIQVKDSGGKTVRGQWAVATNRQMLLFNAAPGLYSIDVGSGLTDKGGRNISEPSAGLVFVR